VGGRGEREIMNQEDLTAYDDPALWPELVDRAEQTAKSFASANNLPCGLSLEQYKELDPIRPIFVYLFFAL
jgi:hypothetical protein